MSAADQRGDDVAAFGAEVVVRAERVGRERGDEADAVLPAIRLTQLPAGQLGRGVGLARRFQRAGHQRFDCTAAAERAADSCTSWPGRGALSTPWLIRLVNDMSRDEQVVEHQLGGPFPVQPDAAGLAGSEKDVFGPGLGEEIVDLSGGREVRLVRRRTDELR